MIISYEHHGRKVYVNSKNKGKHREHCLCYKCKKFNPKDRENNCTIANEVYANCVKYNIITPVYECPEFVSKEGVKICECCGYPEGIYKDRNYRGGVTCAICSNILKWEELIKDGYIKITYKEEEA
ncbi:MAG TPA: hypothetical protein ENG35_00170 [Desulfobacteraceae bacterium]|nr:hypothetical protein [Desulfobacteraceae bacterium]